MNCLLKSTSVDQIADHELGEGQTKDLMVTGSILGFSIEFLLLKLCSIIIEVIKVLCCARNCG